MSWARQPASARDIGFAALLSAWAVLLVTGTISIHDHGGVLAAIGVLAMTVPVSWARGAPLMAAAVVAAGSLANELLVGPMVRCGPCLPAVLLIAFWSGNMPRRPRLVVAVGLCAAAITAQAFGDPNLGPGFVVTGLPAVALACAAGQVAHQRSLTAAALRARNRELRAQRDQTAELAVAADRARVAGDLHDFVRDRIGAMAKAATAGRDLIDANPAMAHDALVQVELGGRETLAQMREVVGNLREERLIGPQPVLADLDRLLDRATTATTRLRVSGSPRTLPSGLELSAYRIVEHLLEALDDVPGARVDVSLWFGDDALEVEVAGPVSGRQGTAFATARERVALHGGTLRIETAPDGGRALVRLPLAPGYANL